MLHQLTCSTWNTLMRINIRTLVHCLFMLATDSAATPATTWMLHIRQAQQSFQLPRQDVEEEEEVGLPLSACPTVRAGHSVNPALFCGAFVYWLCVLCDVHKFPLSPPTATPAAVPPPPPPLSSSTYPTALINGHCSWHKNKYCTSKKSSWKYFGCGLHLMAKLYSSL